MNPQLKRLAIPPESEKILRAIDRLDRFEELETSFDDSINDYLLMKKTNYFIKTNALKSLELGFSESDTDFSQIVGVIIMNALANSRIENLTFIAYRTFVRSSNHKRTYIQ